MISGMRKRLAFAGTPGTGAAVLLAAALVLALAAVGEPARLGLRFEPAAIRDGDLWRLFTGHLVHLGWTHAMMNLAALLLAARVLGPALDAWGWAATTLLVLVAVDGGLWRAAPHVTWYVGLSGLLHGWIVAGVLVLARRGRPLMLVLLLAVAAKIAWEQLYGPTPASTALAGGAVIVHAHLWGGLGGLAAGALAHGTAAGRPRSGRYNASHSPAARRRREGDEE